jgi:DNA repair protein RadC
VFMQELIDHWVDKEDGLVPFGYSVRLQRNIDNVGRMVVDRENTDFAVSLQMRGREAEFKKWVDDKVLPMFDAPQITLRGRKVPYTLQNIVEAMTGRVRGREENMTFGEGAARAAASKRFKDLEEMRRFAEKNILPEDEVAAAREKVKATLESYRNMALKAYGVSDWRGNVDTWGGLDASMRALSRWLKKGRTAANMRAALWAEGFNADKFTDAQIKKAMDAGTAMLRTPVPYFEAKPQRAVGLKEFKGAVIPADASPETRAILEKHGIEVSEYTGDEVSRVDAINDLRRLLSLKGDDVLFDKGGEGYGKAAAQTDTPAFKPAPPFFSGLQRLVEQKMPAKASAEQVRALLRGAKQEEVEWLGVDDFLAGREKVTKNELLDFLRANQVEVKEVLLGDRSRVPTTRGLQDRDIDYDKLAPEQKKAYDLLAGIGLIPAVPPEPGMAAGVHFIDVEGDILDRRELADFLGSDDGKALMETNAVTLAEVTSAADAFGESGGVTRYDDYQLPGGENYRELLLTLPPKEGVKSGFDKWLEKNRDEGFADHAEAMMRYERSTAGRSEPDFGTVFHSSHFDEPNILAHVRFNDRVDADGKRVLFIEEIQSDWHQKGRKQGYRSGKVAAENYTAKLLDDPLGDRYEILDKKTGGRVLIQRGDSPEEAIKTAVDNGRLLHAGVPDAPLKKTWHEFAFKRMVRWAAENGYDRIAWTTGEQQAERYDLSKVFESVSYEKMPDGRYQVEAYEKGSGRPAMTPLGVFAAEDLPDAVGKDLAGKMVAGEGTSVKGQKNKVFEGLDLKVGGEGMKGFYDGILPAYAAKFGKKFGAKVGTTNLSATAVEGRMGQGGTPAAFTANGVAIQDPLRDEDGQRLDDPRAYWAERGVSKEDLDRALRGVDMNFTVHALPVTDAMREAALGEGFAVFDRGLEKYGGQPAGPALTPGLYLRYGGKVYPVENVRQAADMWDEVRQQADDEGFGPDDMTTDPLITDEKGKVLGYVSWNGRVWKGPPQVGGGPKSEEWTEPGGYEVPPEVAAPADTAPPPPAPSAGPGLPQGGTASASSGASGEMVAGVSKGVKPPSPEEAQLAFGFGEGGLEQYVAKAAAPIEEARKMFPNAVASFNAAAELKEKGYVSYVGKKVRNAGDAAELFAAGYRNPFLEHFQVILVRKGQVVAHPTITSGVVDGAFIPAEFLSEVQKMLEQTGADTYYLAHNHPSGNPTPSREDKYFTGKLLMAWDRLPARFGGHVITDDTEFTLLGRRGEQRLTYKKPKTVFRPEKVSLGGPEEVEALMGKEMADKERVGVLLLDARRQLLGLETMPEDADVRARVVAALKFFNASGAVLAARSVVLEGLKRGARLPGNVIDVLDVVGEGEKAKYRSLREMNFVAFRALVSYNSVYELKQAIRVAEGGVPNYMRPEGMDQGDFARALQETGLKAGGEVTARVAVGPAKRGEKGVVVGVDAQGVRLLVRFGGPEALPVVIRPEDTVELRRKPGARAALEAAQAAQDAPPPSPAQVRARVEAATGVTPPKDPVLVDAVVALRRSLRERAAAANKAHVQTLRAELRREAVQGRWEEATRRKLVEVAKEALPPAERGAFLQRIATAKDHKDFLEVFWAVEAKADQVEAKAAVRDVKVLLRRMLTSPSFPLAAKQQVQALMEGLRVENWTESTQEKVAAQAALVEEARASGEGLVFPRRLLDRIAKLGRKPLNDLPLEEAKALRDALQAMWAQGADLRKLLADWEAADAQDAVQQLQAGTKGLKSSFQAEGAKRAPLAADLAFKQRWGNEYLKLLDTLRAARYSVTPMAAFMELVDGAENGPLRRLVYDRFAADYGDFLRDLYEGYLKPRDAAIAKWGDIKIEEAERVGVLVHAAQEGGREKLHQLGIGDDVIDGILKTASKREREMAAWLRNMVELKTKELYEVEAAVHNRAPAKIENYFPMVTDWARENEHNTVEQDVAPSFSHARREAEAKFLKERADKAEQKIVLDPFKVLDQHLPKKLWFIHMGETLKDVNAFLRTPEAAQALGDVGHPLVIQWMDAMARMGGVEGARRMPWLARLMHGFGAAAIAWNPGSALIQPSSLGDAAAKIGGKYVAKGVGLLTDPAWQATFDRLSPKLKYRGEGRNLYTDVMPGARMGWFEKAGGAALRMGDHMAARATFGGAYALWHDLQRVPMDPAKPSAEAAKFAQGVLDSTQASPHLVDLPMIMATGRTPVTQTADINRALAQFQLFLMSRQSHIWNDIVAKEWKRDKAKAAMRAGWLMGAMAYEAGMQYLLAVAAAWFVGRDEKDSFWDFAGKNMARSAVSSFIPIVPNAVQSVLYGADFIPALSVVRKGVVGLNEIAQGAGPAASATAGAALGARLGGGAGAVAGGAVGYGMGKALGFKGGQKFKAAKGVVDVLTALAAMRGVPGALVFGRTVRRQIPKDPPR